jgi:hypothetical protein
MRIYVLSYSHKHGLDTSAYKTEERAHEAMKNIVETWIEDFTRTDDSKFRAEERAEVLRCIAENDYAALPNAWSELTNYLENIELAEIELID